MSGTFTDAIYLCYSTNVKKKCKGFQWHTVRNTGEIPIQHLAKMQMGVYIMELTEKKEFDLLSLGEIMLRLSPPDNERITRGDSFSKQAGGAELNAITDCAAVSSPSCRPMTWVYILRTVYVSAASAMTIWYTTMIRMRDWVCTIMRMALIRENPVSSMTVRILLSIN